MALDRKTGEQQWEYKQYMKAKHEILRKYTYTWANIIKSGYERVLYVDGFAGKGSYRDGEKGSPIIVIETISKIYQRDPKKIFIGFFIESKKENAEELAKRIDEIETEIPTNVDIKVLNTTFENFFEFFKEKSDEGLFYGVPNLFFLDPFGYSQITMDKLRFILDSKSCEFLMIFMYEHLNRFITETSPEQKDAIFGEECACDGLESCKSPQERETYVIDKYKECLYKYANARYVSDFRVKTSASPKSKTKYYLIHGTNHFKGFEVMRENMFHVGGENFTLYGSRKMHTLTFFVKDYKNEIKSIVLEMLKEKKLLRIRWIKEEIYQRTFYLMKHIRETLKEMEKNGEIVVKRYKSKKTGIKEGDLIARPN